MTIFRPIFFYRKTVTPLYTSPSSLLVTPSGSRLGSPKAITATAHKIARIFYKLWTTGADYTDPGMDYYEQRHRERMVNNLHKKAQAFGFELIPQPSENLVS